MAKVAVKDFKLDYINIKTVFLNPPLQKQIYMQILDLLKDFEPNLKGVKNIYLKLNKSLYGLKQALRKWFHIIKKFFKSIGLKSADVDPNLFIGNEIYVLLFVDDMLIAGKRRYFDITKIKILREWRYKDLGFIKVFIGFQIDQDHTN